MYQSIVHLHGEKLKSHYFLAQYWSRDVTNDWCIIIGNKYMLFKPNMTSAIKNKIIFPTM